MKPGPRKKPLSRMRWKATPHADERVRVPSFNATIMAYFQFGARPTEVVDQILSDWRGEHGEAKRKTPARAYVQQRVYELRRRGLLKEMS
jgi:hypothetical protein